MWPAVPIRNPVVIDKLPTMASRRNSVVSATASHASSMSDNTFNRLFDDVESPLPTTSFFEEGFATESGDNDANGFQFDSMADFDTKLSTQAIDATFDTFDSNNQYDPFSFDFQTSNDTIVDFSDQSAATSSVLQPSVGASS